MHSPEVWCLRFLARARNDSEVVGIDYLLPHYNYPRCCFGRCAYLGYFINQLQIKIAADVLVWSFSMMSGFRIVDATKRQTLQVNIYGKIVFLNMPFRKPIEWRNNQAGL